MLWQYSLPGTLVHLEGEPILADGRLFIGGGNAGVLALDLRKLSLEGRPLDAAGIAAALERRWQSLQAQDQLDKVKDPDFAIEPSESDLPKPAPEAALAAGARQVARGFGRTAPLRQSARRVGLSG